MLLYITLLLKNLNFEDDWSKMRRINKGEEILHFVQNDNVYIIKDAPVAQQDMPENFTGSSAG